ncbi:macrolide 2'-phosphotransferase [Arthrobacter gengyunqii]|uniref:Macrolide 2'-phosphotransferase n=1 Tax=Arthrobacter gengyunqii TaxID=2886940 RepID=A0A9X1S5P7_9MICC|nr:macrolide 2'-phosphotransferase [Arthrobacter gengyunqii]MCC3268002.1 macrolide 2'-phosphotransferase [Arthrobacter gengyunqii]UOY95422.1 macrolide 2'-phosphotransferase [Arthrobacter gengyunqii]
MKRTPMELAAMASAAVPGLAPTGVAGSPDDAADFDSAILVDEAGKQWRVRSPKHIDASMRLETELLVLRAFVPAVRAELPFALPYVAGTVRQGDLCTFVYSHLPGSTRDIDSLVAESGPLPREVGRAMAAIHSLPHDLVNDADLPSYSANEFRQRKLNELDQAATTGKIPPVLLRRWEHALEDVTLWRFNPSVVHGDLHEDNLLVSNGRISAVTGWTDLRIGDPADDFAWLIAANDPTFTDAVHAAYNAARSEAPDPHLIRRAALSAEFALAQWLVRGVAAENPGMVAEAEEMLATLEADILEQEAAEKAEQDNAAAVAAESAAANRVAAAEKAAAADAQAQASASASASASAQAAAPSVVLPASHPAPAQSPTVSGAVSAGSSRVSVMPIEAEPLESETDGSAEPQKSAEAATGAIAVVPAPKVTVPPTEAVMDKAPDAASPSAANTDAAAVVPHADAESGTKQQKNVPAKKKFGPIKKK